MGIYRLPSLLPIAKKNYLNLSVASTIRPPTITPLPYSSPIIDLAPTTRASSSTSLPSQPLRAWLYFESAEGFGDLRIYLSDRGQADLRKRKRDDARSYDIVLNKLK